MADEVQTRKIKCPHCGWVRTMTVHVKAGQTEVVAGPGDWVREVADRIKEVLNDSELEEANSWITMPPCPNPDPPCGKTYEYNLRSGATRI